MKSQWSEFFIPSETLLSFSRLQGAFCDLTLGCGWLYAHDLRVHL